jgi:hypothetical protein
MNSRKFYIVLATLCLGFLSHSCNQSNKEALLLCERYNSQAPFKIDGNTTLTKVVCTDAFFTFHYVLSGLEFNEGLNSILETSLVEQLKKVVNTSTEIVTLKKSKLTVGYVYEDEKKNVLFVIIFRLVNNAYVYDEQLSQVIFTKLSKNNDLHSDKKTDGLDSYNWNNEEHKIYLNIPNGFQIIENDGIKMLLFAVDTVKSRSIELIFSDDVSFKIITQEDYSNQISKVALQNVLAAGYEDVILNIWEPSFHTKFGDVVHMVYTGKIIDNGIRQTNIVFQFIRNKNLYTIKGYCMPDDLRETSIILREVMDGLLIL